MHSNWSINIGAVYEYKYCECYCISTVLLFLNSTEDDDDDDNNDSSSIGANLIDDNDSDDTSDGKDSADSNSGDYDSLPFDVRSQTETETEEEPLMESDDLSSDLESEDENITYGKRYANYNLSSL